MLSKTEIFACNDISVETVPVPEWGGDICLKTLESSQFDQWSIATSKGEKTSVAASLIVLCAVDDSGKRLFEDSDEEALSKKSASALNRLFNKASQMNGLTKKDKEELEKNLEKAQKSNLSLD